LQRDVFVESTAGSFGLREMLRLTSLSRNTVRKLSCRRFSSSKGQWLCAAQLPVGTVCSPGLDCHKLKFANDC